MSQYLTTSNAWPVTNQDLGHSVGAPLCSWVLTLSFWDPGDVKVRLREGLRMGKGGTQEVLGSGYIITYMDIFQYVINHCGYTSVSCLVINGL